MVELDFVFEPVVKFEVVVFQGGGRSRGEPAVRARAVEQQPGAHGPQQDAQRGHDDDGHQDGVQGVQPRVVLLGDPGDGRVRRGRRSVQVGDWKTSIE